MNRSKAPDDDLLDLEERAERGVYRDWVEAGLALGEIRRRRLYRREHRTFANYVRDRFDLARSTANELVCAADVAADLAAHADIRLPQRHCHLLYRFPDPEDRVSLARRIQFLSVREAVKVVLAFAVPEFSLPTGMPPPPRHAQQTARRAWRFARELRKLSPHAIAIGFGSLDDKAQKEALDDLQNASAVLAEAAELVEQRFPR